MSQFPEDSQQHGPVEAAPGRHKAGDFLALSRTILREANKGSPRMDFVRQLLAAVLEFSNVTRAELRVNESRRYYRGELDRAGMASYRFAMNSRSSPGVESAWSPGDGLELAGLLETVMGGSAASVPGRLTSGGSFWTDVAAAGRDGKQLDDRFRSLAALRFVVGEGSHGLLLLWSDEPGFFGEDEVVFYENVAQTIGMALADRRAQAALRERVKELTCLYSLHRLTEDRSADLHTTMAAAVRLLPPAWLYVDAAAACIRLGDCSYATPGYERAVQRLETRIMVRGERRGLVEVVYVEARPELDEGPFLSEERSLIDSVARHIGQYLEQRLADSERAELEAQLRHADRLATIGQLAAGVAHELNEPVANVLGFAQLAAKAEGLPAAVSRDIEQIVNAALHAREVVSKLMLFARQKLPTRKSVDLNRLVEDGLYFLSARCAKSGIDLVRRLEPGLPELAADAGQLQQVLVNLVVNAIQAMPGGGRLTIATAKDGDGVVLEVADTGTGMSEDVMQRIFVPFYTTKGVGEGTGLGLPVVHGIVTGHGGRIEVSSAPGQGTRVRVYLPYGGAGNGSDDGEDT